MTAEGEAKITVSSPSTTAGFAAPECGPPADPASTETPKGLLIACAIVVLIPAAIIAVLSWQLQWHWLPNLWFNYAWSSDKGNGPEALQQTIVYGLLAIALIPPVRRFAARELRLLHQKMDANRALLHHIIVNHPDIPNEVPGLHPDFQPRPPSKEKP